MGRDLVIGLDQGTTNTKAIALDRGGRIVAEAAMGIGLASPEPGCVEQDAMAMFGNCVACIREVVAKSGARSRHIAAIGIASQTETLIVWDPSTGNPVLPAMVWQCRRGAEEIAALEPSRSSIKQRTGLDLDPTFTAAKLTWVCIHRPEIARGLRDGSLLWGTVDCWLVWKLTGGRVYATDPGNASRTMLYDITRLAWDDELIALFGLGLGRLPECRPSSGGYGQTDPALFGLSVPIRAVMGDQQASLFGLGCFAPGDLKVTYGTGAFVWMNAGNDPAMAVPDGLIHTIAWQVGKPTYALEGFVMQAGAALAWIARHFAIDGGGEGVMGAAEAEAASGGVRLIPAFQGLASPWWQPDLRGALLGLSEATRKGHVAHAAAEAICFQVRAVLAAMGKAVPGARPVKADGGLTRSRYLMRMQADVLGRGLHISGYDGATAKGVAMMAGIGSGLWNDIDALRALPQDETAVEPASPAGWDAAYAEWMRSVDALIALQSGGAPR